MYNAAMSKWTRLEFLLRLTVGVAAILDIACSLAIVCYTFSNLPAGWQEAGVQKQIIVVCFHQSLLVLASLATAGLVLSTLAGWAFLNSRSRMWGAVFIVAGLRLLYIAYLFFGQDAGLSLRALAPGLTAVLCLASGVILVARYPLPIPWLVVAAALIFAGTAIYMSSRLTPVSVHVLYVISQYVLTANILLTATCPIPAALSVRKSEEVRDC